MKANPMIVNQVLAQAGLRYEVAALTRDSSCHVIARGPRAESGRARALLTEAQSALHGAGYDVEWVIHEGINNSYLVVIESLRNPVRRRVESAAARFLAETDGVGAPAEPTNENLAAAFAPVVRPIDPELYPHVRARVAEIRAARVSKKS